MPKHDHTKPPACEHSLKHCADCDIVFCEKCPKEWAVKSPLMDLSKFQRTNPNITPLPYYGDPPPVINLCSHAVGTPHP